MVGRGKNKFSGVKHESNKGKSCKFCIAKLFLWGFLSLLIFFGYLAEIDPKSVPDIIKTIEKIAMKLIPSPTLLNIAFCLSLIINVICLWYIKKNFSKKEEDK